MTFQWTPILPVWLIALVMAGLLALLAYGCRILVRKRVPAKWIAILAVLRLVIMAVFLACLLQPVAAYTRTVVQRTDLLVLVDTSKSMAAKSGTAKDGPSGKTRLQAAVDTLAAGEMAGQLARQFKVHWFAFDDTARPLESAALKQLAATGDTTHYAAAIATAWSTCREQEGERSDAAAAARVLLVSDGNDHGDDDPVRLARRLGLAVDVLLPPKPAQAEAPAPQQPGAEITSVQCPRSVLLGTEIRFVVNLRRNGSDVQTATVELTEDGQVVQSFPVDFAANEQSKQASVVYHPPHAGLHAYGLALPVPAKPFDVSVQVVNRQYEVLMLEDSWRWEFKYLRRVFEDDPHFSLTAFASRSRTSFVQFSEPERRVNLGGFPQSWSDLAPFDMIVLGDVDPSRWPEALPAAIHRLVVEEGKSLIYVAGSNMSRLTKCPEIETLLPAVLTDASARPVGGPVQVRVSVEGVASAQFFRPDAASQSLWQDLPPMDQIYPPLRKKPGATILVEARQQSNEFGNLIAVAEQTVGRGRVLYVGTDTLWKWQMLGVYNGAGQTPYTVFWQQTLRAMAPGRTGAVLDLQPEAARYRAGQMVRVVARLQSDRPVADAKLRGAVAVPGGRELPLAFVPDPAKPDTGTAAFEAPVAGQYTISAGAESGGRTIAEVTAAVDVQPSPSEADDTTVDRAALARLARDTGGKEIDPADPATWPPVDDSRPTFQQAGMLDLWNNYTLLFALVALLGLDWVLRLGRGYF